MFARILLSVFLFCVFASRGDANEVRVGDVNLLLTPPGGQCELDQNLASEKSLLDNTEKMLKGSDNVLLAMYVDCQLQAQARAGKLKYIAKKTLVQTIRSDGDNTVAALCADTREQGKKYAADDIARVDKNTKSINAKSAYNGTQFIGVVDETPESCTAALVQRFQLDASTNITQATLYSMIRLRGRTIFYYSFSPYVDEQSVKSALPYHKAAIAGLMTLNK